MNWKFWQRKEGVKTQKRWFNVVNSSFLGAAINGLTADMPTTSQSMDWDLKASLPILRARSRDLSVNNDYAKKFLQMCCTHIVGANGFTLQVKSGDWKSGTFVPDDFANTAIENAFYDWGKRGNCDITGKHSFFDICNLYVKSVAREGEVIIRKIYGAGKYGFQLQILDAERLDVQKNLLLDNGSYIKMGVEFDKYGKPLAYHMRQKHPADNNYYTEMGGVYERVPAEEIYHHFISDRPEQSRGLPWMHSVIRRLHNIGGYEHAAVVAARVGAAKMGFYTSPDGDGLPLADDKDATGGLIQDAEAGAFSVLPAGYDFKTYDPDYPHAMYADFIKANLRGVASGLGVAYNTLSNDLEGVNFSSIRTGVLEERDVWMALQNWMIESFLDDLFSTWLKIALLNRQVKLPNGSPIPLAKFDKFNTFVWQGRRWQWVDPTKDMEANIMAINNGLKDRASVIAEQGRDKDDVFAALAAEQAEIEKMGLIIESPNKYKPDQPMQSGAQQNAKP